jgi:general secretion pathway protein D
MQSLNIGTNEFSSLMTIQPDERSNSVVVSGTVDDIRLLRELIEKLDIALAQVRIQVIIAEVTLTDTDISGITALGLTVGQNSSGATKLLSFAGNSSSTSGTPGTSVAGWDFTNGIVNPLAFNAAFNPTSAGSKNVVHVLQAPVVVTAHNKPAEVTVGEQVPIINGGQSAITTGTTPVNSFTSTYQNVAIDLTVTPLIGDNGDIQLTIDQKVDDLGANVTIQAGDVQPIINHREVKSFLTVKDGQMIVLGGLQETQKTTTQNKTGFIYEIPILSQLLGGHTDQFQRTELLFFIRPHIITPEMGTADTEKHIKEMSNKGQVEQFLKDAGTVKDSKGQNMLDRFKSD